MMKEKMNHKKFHKRESLTYFDWNVQKSFTTYGLSMLTRMSRSVSIFSICCAKQPISTTSQTKNELTGSVIPSKNHQKSHNFTCFLRSRCSFASTLIAYWSPVVFLRARYTFP